MVTKLNLKSIISSYKPPAWLKSLKKKCYIMEESAFTPINAYQGFAMRKPAYVKAENKESLAQTISNAIRH